MSSIFGIFNRDGKPVDKQIVETMLDATSYWEPEEKAVFIDGRVVLGHAMLWNTPESKYEHLPLENDAFILTMDARIDNRDELLEQLELPDRPLSEIGDSEFILAAYKKWGEECPKYLLGDFAFAIWDKKNEQLFCARDHVGIKPFYYFVNDELFIFSNDIRGIVSHKKVPKNFNERAIAIYLKVAGLLHDKFTMFKSIDKLPSASKMVVTTKEIKISKYWNIEDSPKINYKTIDDYAKKLRILLEESVRCRLRTEYPIGSHLSGGLDSSVISVLSARILHQENKKLYSYNWVPAPEKNDDINHYEWSNSERIAKNEEIEHFNIPFNENDLLKIFNNLDLATNDTTDLWYEFPLREIAQKKDIRTILSGWGGDEFITYKGGGYFTEKFWKEKNFLVFFKESFKAKKKIRRFLGLCYRNIFLPILPKKLFCYMPYVDCSDLGEQKFIQNEFKKKMNFHYSYGLSTSLKMTIRDRQLSLFHFGHITSRIESWFASSKKMEYRFPLLDKRLVEFALGLPAECYYNNGIGRYLYRYSIDDILPYDIRWSENKAEPVRVKKYIDLSLKAHYLWLKETKDKKDFFYKNKIINIDYLFDMIEKNYEKKPENIYDLIKISDNIGMAILLLQMGESMKDYDVKALYYC